MLIYRYHHSISMPSKTKKLRIPSTLGIRNVGNTAKSVRGGFTLSSVFRTHFPDWAKISARSAF